MYMQACPLIIQTRLTMSDSETDSDYDFIDIDAKEEAQREKDEENQKVKDKKEGEARKRLAEEKAKEEEEKRQRLADEEEAQIKAERALQLAGAHDDSDIDHGEGARYQYASQQTQQQDWPDSDREGEEELKELLAEMQKEKVEKERLAKHKEELRIQSNLQVLTEAVRKAGHQDPTSLTAAEGWEFLKEKRHAWGHLWDKAVLKLVVEGDTRSDTVKAGHILRGVEFQPMWSVEDTSEGADERRGQQQVTNSLLHMSP